MLASHNDRNQAQKKLNGYSKVMIKFADVLMAYCKSCCNSVL